MFLLRRQKTKPIYGQLISNSGQPDITINAEEFVVGRHPKCNVLLKDPIFPNHLFQITCSGGILTLEALHSNPAPFVYHNSNLLKKGVKVELKPMDQLTINGSRKLIYNVRINRSNNGSSASSSSSSLSNNNNLSSLGSMSSSSKNSESTSATRNRLLNSIFPASSSNKREQSERESKKDTSEEVKEKFKEYFKKRFFGEKEEEGKEKVTFEAFPYYLSDNTKQILIHSAFMHLSKQEYLKFVNNLPISKKILLSGPQGTEIYQELLVKALSNHFNATLITLDAEIMESAITECVPAPSTVESTERDRLDDLFDDDLDDHDSWSLSSKRLKSAKKTLSNLKDRSSSKKDESADKEKGKSEGSSNSNTLPSSKPLSSSSSRSSSSKSYPDPFAKADKLMMSSSYMMNPYSRMFGDRKDSNHSSEPKQLQIEAMFEVLSEDQKPKILFIKEAEGLTLSSYDRYLAFKKELERMNSPLIVIGSIAGESKMATGHPRNLLFAKGGGAHLVSLLDHIDRSSSSSGGSELSISHSKQSGNRPLNKLFPHKINILPPNAGPDLENWNKQLARDTELLKKMKNIKSIQKVLEKNNVVCSDLDQISSLSKGVIPIDSIEKVVSWAVSNHLMTLKPEEVSIKNEKLEMNIKSLEYALNTWNESEPDQKMKSLRNVECENEFEKRVLAEVIPPSELNLAFEDIGALDEVKQTLKELVMLPLQRPELFTKGSLTRPCKGILLFGPPGTGKTMLAKAVATQSGANFINVSMSTIASKWFGEGEKYVKAIFTLASKISPTVIFIDEVDSMLGKRERSGEHEAMRKIKNEFMTYWDGLKTKEKERVLVLAATNRPFDLDDAVLRRLSRRILIDLPSLENRVKILKVILAKEDLNPNVDLMQIAKLTEGFSGSDMKNLCIAAAYQPIREVLDQEKEAKKKEAAGSTTEPTANQQINLRQLRMKDFEKSVNEISASVSEDAASVSELRKWNEMYGEGGNRKKQSLPYFL
eukprot:TRINITY_DN2491_c0_g1_i2.p1 TRINITY_DN2491_c0_g1~~TRINITY_DN2491_c0_g1_i2.p1  ORF type:complete len:992 (-),score=351.68 TRINITY_DN2491_c0_g1_i2:46-3021(-)